ncbi:glycoside hydrolase family 17 protein [Rhodohalobacter sp. 8-1]|uniref:glycoside hydrolase family 17 protein n=1 Tax=Rhodohalobacter sp. 8-1 TaxID=3131972 RepID=UPI0030EF5CB7
MSYREERFLTYTGPGKKTHVGYTKDMPAEEISSLFHELLNSGIHGFCFSLYEEGQGPGHVVSEDQIRRRMSVLKPHTSWVRTFSCTEGNEFIPKVAKEMGIKTLVGAWLGSDSEKNEEEIENLIKLAKEGLVDVAAVGNEVLYRNDLSPEELLKKIRYVKEQISDDIPVGYVDAYYEFVNHQEIADICDVILCNCYPYWEGTSIEDSFQHMQHMFNQAKQAGNGKRVIITETGWPSQGEGLGGAKPSVENAMKYFVNANLWSKDDDIEMFYFSSFDESWKVGSEGDVGAYWGVWDSNGKLKY